MTDTINDKPDRSSRESWLYDPPVQHRDWTLEEPRSREDFFAFIAEELKIDQDALAKIGEHGGLYLGDERKRPREFPPHLKAGSTIHLYRFLREPEPLPLGPEHILWEGPGLVAVNKPAWLPVQGTRVSRLFSLENQLKAFLKIPTLMAAHRLDRQTSGVVLFAKDSASAGRIMHQFTHRQVDKKYQAIVTPQPSSDTWEMKGYLLRNFKKLPMVCYRFLEKENPKAKWSHTDFRVLERRGDLALVEATPVTGRTHQLRVHLSAGGTPILGDTVYGPFKTAKNFGSCRIQLHAGEIGFKWGRKGSEEPVKVMAPFPKDFIWESS